MESHIGAIGEQDFKEALGKINTSNVIAVIREFEKISTNKSLIQKIYNEWASSDGDMQNALKGNTKEGINGIFSTLLNLKDRTSVL